MALLFNDRGTTGGEWSAAHPGRTLPPGKILYAFYRWLIGPQGRSGHEENFVPNGIRSPVRPALSSVAMPTELHIKCVIYILHINMYIKDRFKPIFHFFLHKIIRNLKLPPATVHFAPPPPPPPHSVINQICCVVLKLLTRTDICHTTTQQSSAFHSAHNGSPF